MKTILVLGLSLLLAFPASAPEVPKNKEDKALIECVIVIAVIATGTYATIKLIQFCREHFGNNPPPDAEEGDDWTDQMAAPHQPALPALQSVAGAGGGDSIQSSQDMNTWTTELSFMPTVNWTNRTVTYSVSRCGHEIANKTMPIIKGKAYFDLREINIPPHVGANLFRTVAQ